MGWVALKLIGRLKDPGGGGGLCECSVKLEMPKKKFLLLDNSNFCNGLVSPVFYFRNVLNFGSAL